MSIREMISVMMGNSTAIQRDKLFDLMHEVTKLEQDCVYLNGQWKKSASAFAAEVDTWRDISEAGVELFRQLTKEGDRWAAKYRYEDFAAVDSQRHPTPKEAVEAAIRRFQEHKEQPQ